MAEADAPESAPTPAPTTPEILGEPETAGIVEKYNEVKLSLALNLAAAVRAKWDGLPSYHKPHIAEFADEVGWLVEAAQVAAAMLTDAYLAHYEASLTGQPVDTMGVPVDAVTELRGIITEEVYVRAGVTVYTHLMGGGSLEDAIRMGRERAVTMALTDVQEAHLAAANYIMERKPDVIGYRRVLNGGACRLCVAAASPGKRYKKAQLLPIHPGCSCSVAPIYRHNDPHVSSDTDNLETEEYAVRDHGELGPVLTAKGDHFRPAPKGSR